MKVLKFSKGDFITQICYPNTFAIFGGQAFEPIEKGGEVDYSLICFYNPSYFKQNEDGTFGDKEKVFDFDLDGESTCEYTIQIPDMEFWRLCTEDEKKNALKLLADEKKLAWEEDKKAFRKLAANERVMFENDECRNGANNPMYQRHSTTVSTITRKTITLAVREDWEQKEPIEPITLEHKELLMTQCDKLKYSFNTYGYGTVIYPQSGAQVPRRTTAYENGGINNYCGMNGFTPYWQEYYD